MEVISTGIILTGGTICALVMVYAAILFVSVIVKTCMPSQDSGEKMVKRAMPGISILFFAGWLLILLGNLL